MDRSQLLKRLDRAWEALKASYAGLSDAELVEPGVAGDWSVKDVIAHVTWWEEEAMTHLPLILAGGRPPRYSVRYGGIDAFNAQMAEQKRKLSLSEVLRQRDDTHRRLTDFIQSVPEDQIARETRFRRRLRIDTYGHYPKHAEAIREWRERKCKFCRIVSGELPASIIYEDADVMAFMNIRAVNKGECMVIPKDHIDHFTDIPDDLSAKILAVAQKIGRKILALYKPERIGYVVHGCGVPHTHFAVVPQNDPTDITSGKFARVVDGELHFSEQYLPLIPREELDSMAEELGFG